jgi:putative redox protein
MTAQRRVSARWDGGLRAVVDAGRFQLIVDEPESSGGTDRGPQPTDILLASVASCFALAMAHVARKSGIELADLQVVATGTYDGPRFSAVAISLASTAGRPALEQLIPQAQRVCYVTNTLHRPPEITISVE